MGWKISIVKMHILRKVIYRLVGGGLVTKLCLILATPPTVAPQAPLWSLGFSRQEYRSGLPFPSLGFQSRNQN